MKQQGTLKNVMPANDKPEGDSKFRIALAKTVTTWALVAILAIAALIIVVAGINGIRFPEKEQRDQFFDIAKYRARRASAGDWSLGRNCSRFLFRTGELRGGFKKRCQPRASAPKRFKALAIKMPISVLPWLG